MMTKMTMRRWLAPAVVVVALGTLVVTDAASAQPPGGREKPRQRWSGVWDSASSAWANAESGGSSAGNHTDSSDGR